MRRTPILPILGMLLVTLTSLTYAQYSGTYDVGGGNNDFSTPVSAASLISINGVSGPVICNIYSGTMWSGQLSFPANIPGTSPVNTITFQNAPGHSPVLTAPFNNDNIIYMNSADYITIEGLEFTGCEDHAIFFEGSTSDSCRQIRMIGNYVHNYGTNLYTNSAGILGDYSADCEIIGNEVDGDARGISVWHSDRTLIANNMVYSCVQGINPGWSNCIEVYYGVNNRVYHNSALSIASDILYCSNTEDITIYNNVLYQDYFTTGDFCAIGLYSIASAVSDYNVLYAPNSYVGYHHYHGYIETLSEWQTLMALDSNSISADPNFVSVTDLHINDPSPVGASGIEIPEITQDFDGDARKTPYPDIGADEYIFPLIGSYDINGGNNDFATIDEAIAQAINVGLDGHVYFNVYSGTYNGQIEIPDIPETSAITTITIQAAEGQIPIITNTTGTTQTDGNGFYLTGADFITIQGFEITNTAAHGIMNSFTGTDFSTSNRFVGNYIHDVGVLGDFAGIYLLNSPYCEILRNEIESDYYGIQLNNSSRTLIANNMLYFASISGIYDNDGSDNRYYFNSVYQEMNPTTTYNLYLNHGNDIDVKNNVLYHSGGGTHYTISIAGDLTTYPVTSDYNDLYAPNAYVGYYNGNQATLANWQTATGLDVNSLNVDPSFVSLGTPDLHVNPTSPLDMMGTPIREVPNDFDGTTRNESSPDIGADEFYGPMTGVYDVGGGANHFPTPVSAVDILTAAGMAGPVTFNIFSGTYNGTISLANNISGLGAANPLIIQNAPGETPEITSSLGYGILINRADYITIQGLDIHNCDRDGIRINGASTDSALHIKIIDNYIHNVGMSITISYAALYSSYGVDCEITGNKIDGDTYGIRSSYGSNNLYANNMIYSCGSSGHYSYRDQNNQIFYNSVYMDGGYCLQGRESNNLIVKNNILHQSATSGGYYAIYIYNMGVDSLTCDYNDLYAPDTYVGYYSNLGSSYTTLLDWQTATGWDLNSISANPNYVSSSDLHIISPSPVDSTATPLAEITTDFDGDPRDPITPDIGADEIGATGPPGVVNDLIITLSSSTDDSTDITLFWSPALNAQQYHIYKSSNPFSGFILIGSTPDTTYTDTNAIIGETKSFYYVTTDNEP